MNTELDRWSNQFYDFDRQIKFIILRIGYQIMVKLTKYSGIIYIAYKYRRQCYRLR